MSLKQYVLLDELKPSISIYQRVSSGQRVRIDKIPKYGIPLRVSFTDGDGNYKTHRYKSNAKSVNQEEQIEKQKIPANERFTTQERRDMEFHNMVLSTNKKIAQDYIESLPYMEGVNGTIDEEKTPIYKLVDVKAGIKINNDDVRKRLQAGQFIFSLDLAQAQDTVKRLYGAAYSLPDEGTEEDKLEATHDILIKYMDAADTPEQLDELMKTEINNDEKAQILVGRLLDAGLLSFTVNENQVAKKRGDKWQNIKAISSTEFSEDERQRQFISFLNSDAGKTLYEDLSKDLNKISKQLTTA